MAEPDGGRATSPGAATEDSSRTRERPRASGADFAVRIRASGPLGWLTLALGLSAAILLFATELATLSYRTIGIGGCESRVNPGVCRTTGGAAHSHVLWLVAVVVLVFAFGAAVGRSRPAALALVACGIAVAVIALAVDRPKLGDERGLQYAYTGVRAHTGVAYTLELVAAALCVGAGLVGLLRRAQAAGRGPRDEGSTAAERSEERRRGRSAAGD